MALLTLAACTKPPQKQLDDMLKALQSAKLAKKCAPEAYRSAMTMFKKAQEEAKQKKYNDAKSTLAQAKELLEKAIKEAKANEKICEKIVASTPKKKDGQGDTGILGAENLPADNANASKFEFMVIYFGFNKYDLTPENQKNLLTNIAHLRKNPAVKIIIEGHCDSRGTMEYNLALGEKRARTVWKFMMTNGVEEKRMAIISYGAEKPAALGTGKDDYAKNRRVVLVRK